MTRALFDNMTLAAGLIPNEDGLLADKELRATVDAVQVFTTDGVHNLLQH